MRIIFFYLFLCETCSLHDYYTVFGLEQFEEEKKG